MTRCMWPINGDQYCKRKANHSGQHCYWSVLDGVESAKPQHYVPGVLITFESELKPVDRPWYSDFLTTNGWLSSMY